MTRKIRLNKCTSMATLTTFKTCMFSAWHISVMNRGLFQPCNTQIEAKSWEIATVQLLQEDQKAVGSRTPFTQQHLSYFHT
jgi:hypothetical protein